MKARLPVCLWMLACAACADLGAAGGSTVGATATSSSSAGGASSFEGAGGMGGVSGTGAGAPLGGMGGSDSCIDGGIGEPNDSEATATALAAVDDDCDGNGKGVQGVIDGAGDIDWYVYEELDDVLGCTVDPDRDWSQTSGGQLEVCKYVACKSGDDADVSCPSNATPSTSPSGLPGCCSTTMPLELDVGCTAFGTGNDSLVVYLRLQEPTAAPDNCNAYNVNYAF